MTNQVVPLGSYLNSGCHRSYESAENRLEDPHLVWDFTSMHCFVFTVS